MTSSRPVSCTLVVVAKMISCRAKAKEDKQQRDRETEKESKNLLNMKPPISRSILRGQIRGLFHCLLACCRYHADIFMSTNKLYFCPKWMHWEVRLSILTGKVACPV